ncbi:hypothetical protein Cfor_03997 [Coptotermes formosanus]|uniref:Nose resistant-to-fluoxetine protein N-terminal domain-containing protein n=1 Tax=Coptotermes formosanus TaxID=36987 RepID=A0A6L2PL25_COPFO|nr:hypothetical protein Cfor_03997 [Coptotermes formosanus]
MRNLGHIHSYRIFVCYTILVVVRAEERVEDSAQRTTFRRPTQDPLDRHVTDEDIRPLRSAVSGTGADWEAVTVRDGSDDNVSHQITQRSVELQLPAVISDRCTAKDDPGAAQQKFGKATGSDIMKDKSFQSVFSFVPVLAPTSKQITNHACRTHSRTFVHQLQRNSLWALKMYDSSAKLPSGILRGNVNQLGDFDQCLSVSTQENPSIVGKYCLASVDVRATALNVSDTDTLVRAVYLAQAYGLFRSSCRDPGHFIPQFTTIKWALCVPASCSYADVQKTLVNALHDYNETTGLSFDVHVDPEMCYVKQETRTLLSFGTVITLLLLTGHWESLLMAFSLRKNARELLADLPVEGNINCIHGVRALCIIATYMAHKFMIFGFIPYSNRVELTEVPLEKWTNVFRTGMVYTDSFLMISGVLTSFSMSKEIERKKHIDWIKKYMARFIRLTPALVAVLLFYAYVMEHLGSGPQWNVAVRKNADICKENLWKNILYIQNFFPFEQMCATQTHHLALDMQLSLLSPLLVTLLWQWRVGGVIVLLCLHALSAILRYVATLRNQLSHVFYHGITVKQLYKTTNLSYGLSLHRATPYLLGVSLGYLLHKTSKHVHISKVAVWAGWVLAICFAYFTMFLRSDLGLRHYRYDAHDASIYAAYAPITWSLALGWLIWACFTGYGGALNTFLCCKFLVIISRISYAVYLTQFVVFFYNVGSIRASEQFSLLRSVDMAELLTVLLASVLVTLLFDLPMQEVKNIVAGGGNPAGIFGVDMDTGGLIETLNGFVAPSSEIISGDLCREHGQAYLQALQKATGWAVKMWDSSAKIQTGLMTGNLNSLGNFDECISVKNISNHDTYFSGQHCLATLKVENISVSDAMGKTFENIMAEEKEINVGLGSLLSKGLRWGFCIPSTCTSEDLAAELSEFIGNTSGVNVSVSNTDCHFDDHKSFNSADWLAIIREVLGNGENGALGPHEDITPITERAEDNCDPWTVFSVISNGKKIFRFEDSSVKLQSLYGIKFLSVCWVLIGHMCLVAESLPAMNYVAIRDYTRRWFAMPLLNASLAADSFIVITGILTSYNFLRDMRRRGIYRRNSNRLSRIGLKEKFLARYIPAYYLHRHFRVTPSLAAIILLQVSLLGHIGSGPFWKSGNFHLSEACRDGWRGTLLYTQNFVNSDNMCPTHSWYLMVDMQLYTISPFILLFLLAWSKRRSLIAVSVLISMGLVTSFLVNYLLELPAGIMTGNPSKWQMKRTYDSMATYTRFAPWMIGIGVGYLLYCCRRKGKLEISMKPSTVLLGWILSVAALFFAVFGVFPFQQPEYEYNATWSALYSSSCHAVWALGVGWIVLACESNHGGVMYTVLSWKIFQPLSRLTFCIYLVHLPLITARTLMTRIPVYFDGVNALSSVLGDLLFSIVLATILSLFVEMPFIRLFKYASIKLGIKTYNFQYRSDKDLIRTKVQQNTFLCWVIQYLLAISPPAANLPKQRSNLAVLT